MENIPAEIIAFIGKQLRYRAITPYEIIEICAVGYSVSDIIKARNIVTDAFGDNVDFSQPRSTDTTSIRTDLVQIMNHLERFPCSVGQERQYTDVIGKRALFARLDGMSDTVRGLFNKLRNFEESMPSRNRQRGLFANAADPGQPGSSTEWQDNPVVRPVCVPWCLDPPQEINVVATARPATTEDFCQFSFEDIHDEPDAVGAGLQALCVNSPIQTSGPEEEVRGNPNPLMGSTMNEDAHVSTPSLDWVESDLSSLSGESSNAGPGEAPLCSDDDDSWQNAMNPSQNRWTKKELEPQTQMPRLIAPPAQRFQLEARPGTSQPILIPQPIRLRSGWPADDESPSWSSDLELPGSKRPRRMDRPE